MIQAIYPTTCPANSQLLVHMPVADFEDAFAFQIPENTEPIAEVYSKIFNTAPPWVQLALRFRNVLMAPFGLKTKPEQNREVKEGAKVGIFRIYQLGEHEVIAGEDDRHLNFRVSVHRNPGTSCTVTVSTRVQFHNLFGRIYMGAVAPFHKMVVKSMLKNARQRFSASL